MSSIKRLIKFFIFLRFSYFPPSALVAWEHAPFQVAALRKSLCEKLTQAWCFYIFLYNFDITIICLVNIAMFWCYLTAIVAYSLLLWTRHNWLSIVSKSLSPFVNPRNHCGSRWYGYATLSMCGGLSRIASRPAMYWLDGRLLRAVPFLSYQVFGNVAFATD